MGHDTLPNRIAMQINDGTETRQEESIPMKDLFKDDWSNDGTKPQQDFSELLDGVLEEHACTDYTGNCKCNPGECEQRFRDKTLGDNDLEQFDKEALEYFIKFINDGINNIAGINTNMISDVDLDNLQALRIMMYNAKNKKK